MNAEGFVDLQQESKRQRSMQKVLLNAAGFSDPQQESERRRSMQSVMLNAAGFAVNAEGFVTSQQQKRRSKQRKHKTTKQPDDTNSEGFSADSQKESTRMKSNRKIESMISMMTISFYVCWTPYVLRVILDLFGVPLSAIVPVLCLHLAKLRIIVNPILYIFFNKEVRFSFFKATFIV